MELGGSDAFVVLDDADLDRAVEWGVWAKMNNNGQCCVAAKRFLIVDALADRFMAGFQSALGKLTPVIRWIPQQRSGPCRPKARS